VQKQVYVSALLAHYTQSW